MKGLFTGALLTVLAIVSVRDAYKKGYRKGIKDTLYVEELLKDLTKDDKK